MSASSKEEHFQRWIIPAREHHFAGRVATALACLERYASFDPGLKYMHLLRGAVLADLARLDEAEAAIEQGLPAKRSWLRAWALQLIAEIRERQGKVEEAIDEYRAAAELLPNSTTGWILLGACLARYGRLAEAEAVHRRASVLEGDPDEALTNLGLVLRAQGRLEEACEAFQRVLELDPDDDVAKHALEDSRAALEIQRTSRVSGD